jgi:hypothetical protein
VETAPSRGTSRTIRRRMPKMLVAVFASMALIGISPSAANAHESSYCGHGTDGWRNLTVYVRYHNGLGPTHVHEYAHYFSSVTGPIYQHSAISGAETRIDRLGLFRVLQSMTCPFT